MLFLSPDNLLVQCKTVYCSLSHSCRTSRLIYMYVHTVMLEIGFFLRFQDVDCVWETSHVHG